MKQGSVPHGAPLLQVSGRIFQPALTKGKTADFLLGNNNEYYEKFCALYEKKNVHWGLLTEPLF